MEKTSYQFTFPAEGVASIITGPELQLNLQCCYNVGALLTVAVMAVVRDGLVQPFAMTST
jgi:hypothetical protein